MIHKLALSQIVLILCSCSADVFKEADIIVDSGNNLSDSSRDSNVISDAGIDSQDSKVIIDSSLPVDSADTSIQCLAIGSGIPSSCYGTRSTCQCQANSCGSDSCCYVASGSIGSLSCTIKDNITSFGGSECSTASCASHGWQTICKNDKDCPGIQKCYSVTTTDTGWEFGLCQ